MSIRDIKLFLFVVYAFAYPIAVVAPILLDPLLISHHQFAARSYPNAPWQCSLVYLLLLISVGALFRKTFRKMYRILGLYSSTLIAAAAFAASFYIFLPEFPHGNVFAVGSTTVFLAALSIFVWSICQAIATDVRSLPPTGQAVFDYIKSIFVFVRQGLFACVALFGALFFAAFTTSFKYIEGIVSSKSDIFLLNLNGAVQIFFYTTIAVVGSVRYFFLVNMVVLAKYRDVAIALDRKAAVTGDSDTEDDIG